MNIQEHRTPITAMLLVKDDRHVLETVAQLRPHVEDIAVGYTPNDRLLARELADAGADVVVEIAGPLMNWADARNRVMAAATQPFCMWADSDDEFEGLERLGEAIALLEQAPLARVLCPYEYGLDKDTGEVALLQWRERIWRNDGRFEWRYPCHEVLVAKDGQYGVEPRCDFVVWKHRRQEQPESDGHQLEMLTLYEKDHADDPWLLVNKGLTLLRLGRPKEAVPYLEKSVARSGWDDERAVTMLDLAHAEQQAAGFGGDDARVMQWLERARDLRPDWFEPHYEIGKLWYLRAILRGEDRGLPEAANAYARARACPPAAAILPRGIRPLDRAVHVHDCERQVHELLGDWRAALEATERALAARPEDAKLRVAKKKYEAAIKLETMKDAHEHRITQSIQYDYPTLTASSAPLDIVFACGRSWTAWNPAIVDEQGFGGSETAVVEMARRLRAQGHRVRVFCSSGGSGIYDGVEYRDTDDMREGESVRCDLLVAWRNAQLLEFADARVRVAWAHDIELGNMTPKLALKADRVLALSEWHKGNLVSAHGLEPGRVHVTRNGIDLARFAPCGRCGGRGDDPEHAGPCGECVGPRNPHRAVYSSSLDRGLQVLLDLWPAVRERVPDATLDVFYGADTWLEVAERSKSQQQRYAVYSLLRRLKTTAGVTYHGRVDQKRLAREMLSAGAWIGSLWFPETSCIGAMEAQAAGLRCIAAGIAALNETIADRGMLIFGDWMRDDFQGALVDAVVRALTVLEGEWLWPRDKLQAHARANFGWDGVVTDWLTLFDQLLRDADAGAMPAYAGRV